MSAPPRSPKSLEFRREREQAWRRLEWLVARIEKDGLRSLEKEELIALPGLHRAAVSALSVARAISLDRNLLEYLEGLSARSYFAVYGVRRRARQVLLEFFARRFPAAVRAARRPLTFSAALLLGGMALGFALTLADLDRYHSFVSAELASGRVPGASDEALRAPLYDDGGAAGGQLASFASFLFDHNARIGILCFALGFAAGVPVLYLLFVTGAMLGAMAALYHSRGMSLEFFAWILPHGITEMLAVVLCGAAGLELGRALLFPGRRTRMEELAERGREAGLIVVGAVALFLVAALIEGFFRQLYATP